MSNVMRAVRYLGRDGVALVDVPSPNLRTGEVLIHPTYTGICGTDVHVSHGLHPRVRPPVTLGHEFAGTVIASESPEWSAGDRVAVEPLRTCGTCPHCNGPHYNRCQRLQILGVDADGSLAGAVAVPAARLLKLQPFVPDRLGAMVEPLAVAAHAVATLGASDASQPILIFGGGPIGWLAAVILGIRGHEVHVAELNPFRQDMIRRAGHTVVQLNSTVSPRAEYAAGLEASGTEFGLRALVESVSAGGTISTVGLPKGQQELDVMHVISKELQIRGSRVYTRHDFVEALGLIGDNGELFEPLVTHEITFDEVIEQGLRRIEAGGPVGKILVRGTL